MLTRHRLWLAGLLAIPVLVAAAVAYACTPTAYIAFDKPSYRPGDTVTVNGRLFEPKAARPAEVRFGPDQAVVGRAAIDGEGSWSLSFSLPQGLSSGAYLVTAPAYDENDQIVKVARASLQVAAPSTPTASPTRGAASKPSAGRKETASNRAGREAAGGLSATRPAPVAAPARSPQLRAARSVAGERGAVSARRSTSVNGRERTATPTRPSERAATADLWSRLASGRQPSLLPSAADASPPSDGPGTQLLVGIGLLAAGLVALASGFAVAEMRRRRSRIPPQSR